MTHEERARKLAERLSGVGHALHGVPGYVVDAFMNETVSAFADTAAEEREACAMRAIALMESLNTDYRHEIAEAIRARGKGDK